MIYTSIVLFALAAVLGLTILINWLSDKEAPRAVIYSHGIVAAVALALLIVYAVQHPADFPKISIILFAIAALAGFYMFFINRTQKKRPLAVAFTHALVAVSAFILLLFFVL